MAALTTAYETFEKPGLVISYKISAVKVYKGALLGVNASGFAVPMDHAAANLKFTGVANETVDNSAGDAGDKNVNVTKSGTFVFKAASGFTPAQADVGKEVYANTPQCPSPSPEPASKRNATSASRPMTPPSTT